MAKKNKSSHPSSSMRKRGAKREIIFDPEARKAYLRGFSERKRQRRAYGLAMQKVKDRKAKIEQRAKEKKDELERVEQAEEQKDQLLEEVLRMNDKSVELSSQGGAGGGISNDNKVDGDSDDEVEEEINLPGERTSTDVVDKKVYDDQETEQTWGGQVIVTTSVVEMGDESDENLPSSCCKKKSVDVAQRYAGNVTKYFDALKGKMPGKRSGLKAKRKGKNGAADMKGVGGSYNLKIATRLLSKSREPRKLASATGKKRRGKRC